MSDFVVELPSDLRAEEARRGGIGPQGESAWVAEAVREKLVACAELDYLEERAARGSEEAYRQILARVPATDSDPSDR